MIDFDTWIISDTHFGHANIIKYCSRPENHDELMADLWHLAVGIDEQILHLGDLAFKTSPELWDVINGLPGRKMLIMGNHDRKAKKWYEDLGFQIMPRRLWFNWNGRQVLFTHDAETEVSGWSINIHGHIHNNGYPSAIYRSKDYRNVSVEVMGYQPVRLREILEEGRYQASKSAPISEWTPRVNA